MTTLSLKQDRKDEGRLQATLKVAGYLGLALLAALLLGTLLSCDAWTLPMDPAIAANFTA